MSKIGFEVGPLQFGLQPIPQKCALHTFLCKNTIFYKV